MTKYVLIFKSPSEPGLLFTTEPLGARGREREDEEMSVDPLAPTTAPCLVCLRAHVKSPHSPSAPETSKAFTTFSKLLNLPTESDSPGCWNFDFEPLPLCPPCASALKNLRELSEEVEKIQREIRAKVVGIKEQIRTSHSTHFTGMVTALRQLGVSVGGGDDDYRRITDFRSQVLQGLLIPIFKYIHPNPNL
jgi:hypothetical protein